LKLDTTPALQTFTIKAKKIDTLASENIFMSLFGPNPRQQSYALFEPSQMPLAGSFPHQVCNVRRQQRK
jgi:hypothetical protein